MLQGNWCEDLIGRVGGEHRYQYCLFANFSVKWMVAAMVLFSLNFFYYVPEFTCTPDEVPASQTCEEYVCSVDNEAFWVSHLEDPIPSSIALDYGVIMLCSNQWISSLLQSISYFGSFVGFLLMGHLADNIGRKKVEFASWVISLLGLAMLVGSGSSLYVVGLGSFLMGYGTNAAITLHYTFLKELCLGSFRERSIIILQIMFSLGVSLVALSCLLIPDWKIVAGLCIGLPALAVTAFSFMIEETPHFSLKKGRMQLLASLNRIARYNRRDELTMEDLDMIGAEEPAEEADHGYSLWDLFRYRSVRVMALVCAGMDMIIEFVYDGSLLSLDKIGEDVYVNQILVGLVEIGAAVFCSWVVVRVNRKPFSRYSLALIGLFTLIIGVLNLLFGHVNDEINVHAIVEMVMLGCMRFIISSLWAMLFVFFTELFPSRITSLSFGWISAMGTVGAVSAPFIRLVTADTTMFVMSALSFFSIFLLTLLPETKGKTIRQQIEQKTQVCSPKQIFSEQGAVN